MKLAISPNGAITAIYSDDLESLMDQAATKQIVRQSHVEPGPDGMWYAEMIGDGAVLGPYKLRAEALAAEVEYLEAKLFAPQAQTPERRA